MRQELINAVREKNRLKMLPELIVNLVSCTQLGVCLLLNRATLESFLSPSLAYYLATSLSHSLFFFFFVFLQGYSCHHCGCHQFLETNQYSFIFTSDIVLFPSLSFPNMLLPTLSLLVRKCLKSKWHSFTIFQKHSSRACYVASCMGHSGDIKINGHNSLHLQSGRKYLLKK